MRKPLMAGNWKMNKTVGEANMVKALKPAVTDVNDVEILLCPTYTALYAVNNEIKDSNIKLGAQNLFGKVKVHLQGNFS